MAFLNDKQRGELRHIRNEAFKRTLKYGYKPRHPNKPAPEYKARANCVRLDNGRSRRPDKSKVYYSDVATHSVAEVVSAKESTSSDFDKKLARWGWDRTDWAKWVEARKDNPSLTLHDYRKGLKSE